MLQSSSSGSAEKVNLCPVPGESLEPALYTPNPRSCSTSLGLKVQLSIRLVIDKHVLARTVFLIRFLSITGFTGSKTHAEKFCRLHSLLSPSEGWGILKYSCYRPAGCRQTVPWAAAPGAEEGASSASRAGAPGPLSRPAVPGSAGQFLPGKHRLPERPTGSADRSRGARQRRVRERGAQG